MEPPEPANAGGQLGELYCASFGLGGLYPLQMNIISRQYWYSARLALQPVTEATSYADTIGVYVVNEFVVSRQTE